MKKPPKKQYKTKVSDFPNPNLKPGEVGFMIVTRRRYEKKKYYTVKGKEEHSPYFLHALVKTAANLFDMKNIDLVEYVEAEPIGLDEIIDTQAKIDDVEYRKQKTMEAIEEVIREKASEDDTINQLEDVNYI